MAWTDDRIAELRRLWEQGLTTGEIGKVLGVSKNAVVGKAHRLGLAARPSPIKRGVSTAVKAPVETRPAKPVEKPKPVAVEERDVEGLITSVVDLSAVSCRWPHGDPGEKGFHFCGKKIMPGKPYCPDHAAIAYVSGSKKKENAA